MVAMIPRRFAPLVLGSLAVGILVMALGNFTGEGEEGGAGAFIFTTVATLVITALVWSFLVNPRVEGPPGPAITGIILGALAVLFGVVYWTGLAFALGPAAVALGILARERSSEEGTAVAAIGLGALGLLIAVVFAIVDLSI
jgi:hypothetical protein